MRRCPYQSCLVSAIGVGFATSDLGTLAAVSPGRIAAKIDDQAPVAILGRWEQVVVVSPREERQFTVAGLPVEECLGLIGSRQGIGLSGQYQDRHVGRNAVNRLEGRDLLEVGQEEGTNQPQACIAK